MRTAEEVSNLFAYDHLPPHLQKVSMKYHALAEDLFESLEPCAETTLALRKLWDSKNYAVWVAAQQ